MLQLMALFRQTRVWLDSPKGRKKPQELILRPNIKAERLKSRKAAMDLPSADGMIDAECNSMWPQAEKGALKIMRLRAETGDKNFFPI
jgi:hypothetical protein